MARDILFRAWDAATNEMHIPHERRHDTLKTASAHILKHYDVVMQLVGFAKAKDGHYKAVYEGDIVSICRRGFHAGNYEDVIGSVEWNKTRCSFEIKIKTTYLPSGEVDENYGYMTPQPMNYPTTIDVIGDIYRHPELLTL